MTLPHARQFCSLLRPDACTVGVGAGAAAEVGPEVFEVPAWTLVVGVDVVAIALASDAGLFRGLGVGSMFCGDVTVEEMPVRPWLRLLTDVLVSMRGFGRLEPRVGSWGRDSALLERIEPVASYFSFSFSQLQPGSTARLLIRSMSARLRVLGCDEVPSTKDVDDGMGDDAG